MPEQCCGKERTTAFCPDCGKQMKQGSPLHEMRSHFVTRRKIITTVVSKNKIALEEEEKRNPDKLAPNARFYEKTMLKQDIRNGEKQILKWNRWIDALDAILSPQEEKPNE